MDIGKVILCDQLDALKAKGIDAKRIGNKILVKLPPSDQYYEYSKIESAIDEIAQRCRNNIDTASDELLVYLLGKHGILDT